MSEPLWGVIIGAMLTGAFLTVNQWRGDRAQANIARESAKAQANAAREAWNRDYNARRHAELESMCVEILRYIQEIEHAVANWDAGGTNMTADQFIDTVNAAARDVMLSGYSLMVRKGPDEPTPPLIGQVVDQARAFSALYHIDRQPPATKAEKHQQALVVSSAAAALRAHVHAMVKADAEAQGISS
jgi:hypothetical protein